MKFSDYSKYLKQKSDIEMLMMKLFIKHVKQMYLCMIDSYTDCSNIAIFHLFFIYLH